MRPQSHKDQERKPFMKLNMGCGTNKRDGFINVDKCGNPDVIWDLETFPWPWDDNSVTEVRFDNILEHLGQTSGVFLRIFQELYRICVNKALITIVVPHPRHNSFLCDPTHVRPIMPETLELFSKKRILSGKNKMPQIHH